MTFLLGLQYPAVHGTLFKTVENMVQGVQNSDSWINLPAKPGRIVKGKHVLRVPFWWLSDLVT